MKITKKLIVENVNIAPRLVAGVIRTIGGVKEFNAHYQDVVNHGADSGFSGFTYYSDTAHFYKLYRKEILQLAEDMSTECGYISLLEMIANFNCLKSYGFRPNAIIAALYRETDDSQYIRNALAWFALEEVCRAADYVREQAETK